MAAQYTVHRSLRSIWSLWCHTNCMVILQYSALTLPEEKYTVDLTTTTKSEHFATPVPLRTAARQVAMATSLFLTPVTCDEVSATPGCSRIVLESDDNITPMPDYRTMRTPLLKVCLDIHTLTHTHTHACTHKCTHTHHIHTLQICFST